MCEGYCDFIYDNNIKEFVCSKCGYILTKEDKRKALAFANALRRNEENWKPLSDKPFEKYKLNEV